MTSLFDMKVGQQAELWRIFDAAGISLEQGEAILRRPSLAEVMSAALAEQLSQARGPILDLRPHFDPQRVIDGMKALNKARGKAHGWQFKVAVFNNLPEPPAWPSEARLPAIVLCANLDTVGNTFNEACIAAKSRQPEQWEHGLDVDRLSLRFAEFTPNTLWWEAMDLAANWQPEAGRRVRDLNGSSLAHVQCLWAADQYPEVWVQAQNGQANGVPFVDMAGYRYGGSDVPYLLWNSGSRGLSVGYNDDGSLDQSFAAPVCVD